MGQEGSASHPSALAGRLSAFSASAGLEATNGPPVGIGGPFIYIRPPWFTDAGFEIAVGNPHFPGDNRQEMVPCPVMSE